MIPALVGLLVGIAIIGLVVYLIELFIPMSEPFKAGVRIIAGIIVLLLILQVLGIAPILPNLGRR